MPPRRRFVRAALDLALQALKDLEHRVQLEAETLGFQRAFPEVGPANVKGIELNPYAAELARVSVWIGEIQGGPMSDATDAYRELVQRERVREDTYRDDGAPEDVEYLRAAARRERASMLRSGCSGMVPSLRRGAGGRLYTA